MSQKSKVRRQRREQKQEKLANRIIIGIICLLIILGLIFCASLFNG